MRNERKWGIILSYATLIIQNIISLLYTPFMLRMFGQREYGLYSLVSSVVGYLSILSFGFGSAYVRYYIRYKNERTKREIESLNGMFMTVYLIIAVISLLIGSVLVINTGNLFGKTLSDKEILRAQMLMCIMVVSISISFPVSLFQSCVSANEKFTFQRIVGLIKAIAQPIIMFPVLIMGGRSISMAIVALILSVIVAVIDILYCITMLKMRFCFKNFEGQIFREISAFSFFIFLNMIVDQINWSVDKFVLGMVQGTVAVAIYAVGAQFNNYFKNFSTYISSVYIPKANIVVLGKNAKKDTDELFIKVGRMQFHVLGFVLSGFILFGKQFIELWAGKDYEKSFYIALLVVVPAIVPYIQNIGIEIQKALNKHKFRSVLYFFIALANLMVSIPLAIVYGAMGAALGTAISLLVGNGLIMNIYYYKSLGINIPRFWFEIISIIKGMIIPVLAGSVIVYMMPAWNWLTLILGVALFSIIYFINIYFWGMNQIEKEYIKSSWEKLLFHNKRKI